MALPKIGYAGMTHLGLCSAIGAASKGFETLGFDADAALVAGLEAGKLPVVEPDLDDTLRDNPRANVVLCRRQRPSPAATSSTSRPTSPTDDTGGSDLSGLDRSARRWCSRTRGRTPSWWF